MRIREKHLNGAFIDLQLPDSSGWDVSGMLKEWRAFNDKYVSFSPDEDEEPVKTPVGFTVVEVESDHGTAE